MTTLRDPTAPPAAEARQFKSATNRLAVHSRNAILSLVRAPRKFESFQRIDEIGGDFTRKSDFSSKIFF